MASKYDFEKITQSFNHYYHELLPELENAMKNLREINKKENDILMIYFREFFSNTFQIMGVIKHNAIQDAESGNFDSFCSDISYIQVLLKSCIREAAKLAKNIDKIMDKLDDEENE